MDLKHQFTVPASVAETWAAFEDIESVAECFPGAAVTEVDGDNFKGNCKVKLGPIALVYSGSGTFVEKDQAAGIFKIDAKGKDKRGNGTAGAKVTATLADAGEGKTVVDVVTDLAITGKPAQFGRGVMQDVSDKLLQQFVDCLQAKVGSSSAADPDAAAVGPAGEASTSGSDPEASASTEAGSGREGAAEDSGEVASGGVGRDTLAAQSAPVSSTPTGAASGPSVPTSGAGAAASSSAPTSSGGGAQHRSQPREDDALDLGTTVLPILVKGYWKQGLAGLGGLAVLIWVVRKIF